eukprot:scaffold9968_cov20-Tisochrysis_lutea.AAC.1
MGAPECAHMLNLRPPPYEPVLRVCGNTERLLHKALGLQEAGHIVQLHSQKVCACCEQVHSVGARCTVQVRTLLRMHSSDRGTQCRGSPHYAGAEAYHTGNPIGCHQHRSTPAAAGEHAVPILPQVDIDNPHHLRQQRQCRANLAPHAQRLELHHGQQQGVADDAKVPAWFSRICVGATLVEAAAGCESRCWSLVRAKVADACTLVQAGGRQARRPQGSSASRPWCSLKGSDLLLCGAASCEARLTTEGRIRLQKPSASRVSKQPASATQESRGGCPPQQAFSTHTLPPGPSRPPLIQAS